MAILHFLILFEHAEKCGMRRSVFSTYVDGIPPIFTVVDVIGKFIYSTGRFWYEMYSGYRMAKVFVDLSQINIIDREVAVSTKHIVLWHMQCSAGQTGD